MSTKAKVLCGLLLGLALAVTPGCGTTFGKAFARSWENVPPQTRAEHDAELANWNLAHGEVRCQEH